jgi:hypothetical protein
MNRDERSGREWARPVDDAGPDPDLDEAVRWVLANVRERSTESEGLSVPTNMWTRVEFDRIVAHLAADGPATEPAADHRDDPS